MIYLRTKQLNLSHSIFQIFTQVDEVDGQNDGCVDIAHFVQIISALLGKSQIMDVDIEYLAIKYKQTNNAQGKYQPQIHYKFFYNDYMELEATGLATKIYGIQQAKTKVNAKSNKDPFLRFDIPKQFLDFYKNIEKWMSKKNKMEIFCNMMVQEDEQKEGYLTNKQFDKCFHSVGMSLSKKQIGQTTYSLHQDLKDRYSYPELICYIFGEKNWLNTQRHHNLKGKQFEVNVSGNGGEVDQVRIPLLERLKWQIEYKHDELLKAQNNLSQNSGLLLQNEFLEIFGSVGINLSDQDKNSLIKFFQSNKSQLIQTISVQDLFDAYQLNDFMCKVKSIIQTYLKSEGRQILCNLYLKAEKYTFEEIVNFLKIIKLNLGQISHEFLEAAASGKTVEIRRIEVQNDQYPTEYKDLFKIFNLIRAGNPLITKHQLFEFLEVKEKQINLVDESNLLKLFDLARADNRWLTKEQFFDVFVSITKKKFSDVQGTQQQIQKKIPQENKDKNTSNYQQEDQNKSLKKERQATSKDKDMAQKPPKQSDRQLRVQTVQQFIKYIKADKLRVQRVSRIQERYLTIELFAQLLLDLRVAHSYPEKLNYIIEEFKSSANGSDAQSKDRSKAADQQNKRENTPLISVTKLKKALDINPQEFLQWQNLASQRSATQSRRSNKPIEEQIAENASKLNPETFKKQTKDILSSLVDFLKQNNKIDPEIIFKEMDKDGKHSVTDQEFTNYFMKLRKLNQSSSGKESELDKSITKEKLLDFYNMLDTNKDGTLDLKEFCQYVGYQNMLEKKINSNIDADTQAEIDQKIERLFRKVDKKQKGQITEDELYNLLKPLRPGRISMVECQQILKKFDANNNGLIGKDEFCQILKHELNSTLTNNQIAFQNLKRIFLQYDTNKDGYLQCNQFKQALQDQVDVQIIFTKDFENLLKFLDTEAYNKIQIDEFFAIISNLGSLNFTPNEDLVNTEQNEFNKSVQRGFLEIRAAISVDLFDYFSFFEDKQLPSFFEPSFLQMRLETECRNQPCKNLIKHFDASDPLNKKFGGINFQSAESCLHKFKQESVICFEVCLQDIENVPVPKLNNIEQKGFSMADIFSREVRIILFDNEANQYISNTYILPANTDLTGKKWQFNFSRVQELAKVFVFKTSQNLSEKVWDLQLVFELVLTIESKNDTRKQKSYQVTNGWGSISVKDLLQDKLKKEHRIWLNGGSPANQVDIDPSQIEKAKTRSTSVPERVIAFFRNEKRKDQPNQFFIKIITNIIESQNLNTLDQIKQFCLPDNFLMNSSLIAFNLGLQVHLQDLKKQIAEQQSDLLLTLAKKCWNTTDIHLLLSLAWTDNFNPETRGKDFKSLGISQQLNNIQKYTKLALLQIYERVFNGYELKYKINVEYPTRASKLDEENFFSTQIQFMEAVLEVLALDIDEDLSKKANIDLKLIKETYQGSAQKKSNDYKKEEIAGIGEEFVSCGVEQPFSILEFDGHQILDDYPDSSMDIHMLIDKHMDKISLIK